MLKRIAIFLAGLVLVTFIAIVIGSWLFPLARHLGTRGGIVIAARP